MPCCDNVVVDIPLIDSLLARVPCPSAALPRRARPRAHVGSTPAELRSDGSTIFQPIQFPSGTRRQSLPDAVFFAFTSLEILDRHTISDQDLLFLSYIWKHFRVEAASFVAAVAIASMKADARLTICARNGLHARQLRACSCPLRV